MPLETLWISPGGFVSGTPNVQIAQLSNSPAAVVVTGSRVLTGWVRIALPIAVGRRVLAVHVCHHSQRSGVRIRNMRLVETREPRRAWLDLWRVHEAPVDAAAAAVCQRIEIAAPHEVAGALALELDVTVARSSGQLLLGAVGVDVESSDPAAVDMGHAVLSVRDFGAGDGVTGDLMAFHNAIAAAADAPNAGGRSIWVPKGTYLLGGDLIIDRPVELFGDGPGFNGQNASVVRFTPGRGMITTIGCAIRGLRIEGQPEARVLNAPHWRPNTRYDVGSVVRPADDNRFYFLCVKAGRSGEEQPPAWRAWVISSSTTLWQENTSYLSADFLMGRLGAMVRRADDFERMFQCTRSGRSGGAPDWRLGHLEVTDEPGGLQWTTHVLSEMSPGGYFTYDGEHGVDGQVVWETRIHAGVDMRVRSEVSNCAILNFPNAAIHIQASASDLPPRNCNVWYLSRVNIADCGMGVAIIGKNTNAGYSEGLSIMPVGFTTTHRDGQRDGRIPGAGGVGIWDSSGFGCTHVAAHVEGATGAAYVADSASGRTVFVGCYGETLVPNRILGGIFLGGHNFGGFGNSGGLRLAGGEGRNIAAHDTTGPLRLIAQLDQRDGRGVLGMHRSDDLGWTDWRTDTPEPHVWGLAYNGVASVAITGTRSDRGSGQWIECLGAFEGQKYRGHDAMMQADGRVRGGRREVGDRIEDPSFVGRGYLAKVCTAAGWDGPAWTPREFVSEKVEPLPGLGGWRVHPTVRVPTANGLFAYKCVAFGTTASRGELEPEWPAVPTVGTRVAEREGNVVWECLGARPTWAWASPIGPPV